MRLILPLHIYYGKKKTRRWRVNMNEYRRAHKMVLARVKFAYAEHVQRMLLAQPELLRALRHADLKKVRLIYTLYPFQKCDVENPCCVVSKFTLDALVDMGILPEDDMNVVVEVTYRAGHVDRNNPRCELDIVSIPE